MSLNSINVNSIGLWVFAFISKMTSYGNILPTFETFVYVNIRFIIVLEHFILDIFCNVSSIGNRNTGYVA